MDHLVIAGGVGLNVKVNQRLWEELQLRDIYVQPAAGDAGLVLGACALLQVKFSNNLVQKLDNVYLGPSYNSDLIQDELAHSNLIYTKINSPSDVAADLISKNKIVGWFQGRMEFGPRALGNRSILANPTHPKMQEIVNSKIKFREEFRPFCPSIEENTALRLIEKSKISKFMTISFSAKNNVRERIPAVVHLDNSTRIQTVNQNDNFLYFQILESLENRIGIKAVLNTSMNVRGEPMCESPKDAINFFKNTNVDALIIGSYLVLREQQAQEYRSEVTENRLKTNY
jgi:carbamoyltransferase